MTVTKVWFFMVLFLLLFGAGAGFLNDNQPYLHAAQQALETSRIQLAKVTPDKGGHRSRAIAHINEAIQEVKAAQVEHRNVGYTASNQ
ncbi:MAG TPA: hypothetical protein V6C99_05385 [Oculatellaceae cyanobacterium]